MTHTVEFGEHCYRPTADNPFPFTTSQLARLEVQASRVDTLRLAYRHGQEAFRARHFLPTTQAATPECPKCHATGQLVVVGGGGYFQCYACRAMFVGNPRDLLPTSEPGLDSDAVTNSPLSDTAAGMLGRLDNKGWSCKGCYLEARWGHPVITTMHARNCPRGNRNA